MELVRKNSILTIKQSKEKKQIDRDGKKFSCIL